MPSLETHFFSLKANQYGSLSTKNKQKLVPLCTQMILSASSKRSYVMMRMGTSTAHQSYHQIVKSRMYPLCGHFQGMLIHTNCLGTGGH